MPTLSIDTLSPEQKAIRELTINMLDSHFNLLRVGEVEAKLNSRRDAALKEFARANTADAIIAVSKNVAIALDQIEKDQAAVGPCPKLVMDSLRRLEKLYPEVVKLTLEERKAKDELAINSSTNGQLAFREDLDFVNRELAKLAPPHMGSSKKGAGAAKPKSPGAKPAPGAVATTTTTP